MNQQERFDDLTRALATGRLSRWQVLKSFAAGVLLAGPLGALWHSPASGQQSGTATSVPCANDRVTAASLDAADSALAAGATQVKLSPKGCVRYRRTLKGGRVTSDEVTLEGKTAIVWKHTSTRSTGRRDADLDGFFEWRSKVQRGAAKMEDDRTVTKEYSAATKKLTRRETYTRGTGKGWHVLFQEVEQSGNLHRVAKFKIGPHLAAASTDQGSGGDLPNNEYRVAAHNAKTGVKGLKTTGCTPSQTRHLKARLRDSRNVLIKCLQAKGAGELAYLAMVNYYARPIDITCASLAPGDAAHVESDSVTLQDWTVKITVNKDTFFKPNSQAEQISTLGHEMIHLYGGNFLHNDAECNDTCRKDHDSRTHHDRTYACENLCFGAKTGEPQTKCSCDLCLGTPSSQKCNERCKGLGMCPYPDYEKKCTFCPPGQKVSNGQCVSETCGLNGVSCPPEKPTCCEGVCVNVNVGVVIDGEYRHCGRCGTSCGPGSTCGLSVNRGITCPDPVDGVCSPGMCCGCGAGCNCVPPT